MTRDEIDSYVSGWIDSWNRRDVEAILGHFSEGVQFTSPVAAEVVGRATVHGKEQLRAYWLAAVQRVHGLVFTLDYALWDTERREVAIVY